MRALLLALVIFAACVAAVCQDDLGSDFGTPQINPPSGPNPEVTADPDLGGPENIANWLMYYGLTDQPAATTTLARRATPIVQRYYTKYVSVQRELTSAELIPVLKEMGYWGGAQQWAYGEVAEALRTGRIEGRAGQGSDQWQSPARMEELAAVANRVVREAELNIQSAIEAHNADPNAHPQIQKAMFWEIARQSMWGKIAFWAIVALLLICLILLAFWLGRRRSRRPGPIYRPGFEDRGCTTATPESLTCASDGFGYGGKWGSGLAK